MANPTYQFTVTLTRTDSNEGVALTIEPKIMARVLRTNFEPVNFDCDDLVGAHDQLCDWIGDNIVDPK